MSGGNHHGRVLSGRVVSRPRRRNAAAQEPLADQIRDSGDRTSDSARPLAEAGHPRTLRRSRSSASRATADHRTAAGVNPDASLYCSAPGSDVLARHGRAALGGWSGNAVRRRPLAAPRSLRAVAGTIDLAAVATAADHSLGATTRAKKQPRRRRVTVIRRRNAKWTNATIARIMALHACPARCGARRRGETAKLGSAPCLPSITSTLLSRRPPRVSQSQAPKGQAAG